MVFLAETVVVGHDEGRVGREDAEAYLR